MLIAKASTLFYIMPIFIGILKYDKLKHGLKPLFYVILIDGIVSSLSLVIAAFEKNNSLLLNAFIIPHMLLWSYPFYKTMDNKLFRRIIILSFFVFMAVIFYCLPLLDLTTRFNGTALAFTSVHLIIVSLCYLFFTALTSDKLSFKFHPLFFVASGLLIFHAFVAVLYALMNQIDQETLTNLWIFRSILFLILYIMISLVIWRYARHRN